ncbi:MAG TPA: class I SAM-dependent methyltransferase [Allosphingosinicella sp.]|nr:class I SAM-dependent methyltransferase [Allosphingosinicella sp.]
MVRRGGALVQPLRPRAPGLARPTDRARFLAPLAGLARVLEIGPFDEPLLKGEGVAYFDVLDQEGLRRRAAEHGRNPEGCPRIDYVSATGDLDVVDAKFDAIFSSHAIEHQPDLIGHLAKAEKRLVPGGRYWMIVPDKRYCFDHYSPETTLGEVIQAHRERRTTHSAAAILLHSMLTHNDGLRHWIGLHGPRPRLPKREEDVRRTFEEIERAEAGEYVDVHAWRLTPRLFADLIADLRRLGYTDFEVERVHETAFGAFEFFAVLRLSPPAGKTA